MQNIKTIENNSAYEKLYTICTLIYVATIATLKYNISIETSM